MPVAYPDYLKGEIVHFADALALEQRTLQSTLLEHNRGHWAAESEGVRAQELDLSADTFGIIGESSGFPAETQRVLLGSWPEGVLEVRLTNQGRSSAEDVSLSYERARHAVVVRGGERSAVEVDAGALSIGDVRPSESLTVYIWTTSGYFSRDMDGLVVSHRSGVADLTIFREARSWVVTAYESRWFLLWGALLVSTVLMSAALQAGRPPGGTPKTNSEGLNGANQGTATG